MDKKKLTFIINPVSGVFSKDRIISAIDSDLDKNKYDYSIEFTEGPGHAVEICNRRIGEGVDIIVAVGGDGSVNEIARTLTYKNVALGIIPAGSGNGLAHHLKIPFSYKKAINIINEGKTLKIDTGSINKVFFVSIAGIGFDGIVAHEYAKNKRRGFFTYVKVVTEEYVNYRPRKYTIEINGEILKRKALFISFANSDQFGYGASIAPSASVDDGLLDVIIMRKPPMIEIPLLASLLYWNKIDLSRQLEIIKAKELVVKTRRKRWVNIDGEPLKMKKKLEVKIHPLSLNIIVPQKEKAGNSQLSKSNF
jgi:diacylglycerol kinase (ATP)